MKMKKPRSRITEDRRQYDRVSFKCKMCGLRFPFGDVGLNRNKAVHLKMHLQKYHHMNKTPKDVMDAWSDYFSIVDIPPHTSKQRELIYKKWRKEKNDSNDLSLL